jgi:hypothetical protein
MHTLLNCIDCDTFVWKIHGDLKVMGLLVGIQQDYTKYHSFLCEWDSCDKKYHYICKDWPQRHPFTLGKINVSCEPLVNP